MSEFCLTREERLSPLWVRLESSLKERLDTARRKNDGALSAEDTARLRGRIAVLKELLELGEQAPTENETT